MRLARGLLNEPSPLVPPPSTLRQSRSNPTTTWLSRPSSANGDPRPSQVRPPGLGIVSKTSQTYPMIYDYFYQSFQTALHPISTLEHYWTLRAARAELLLSAREGHKRELTAVYTSHEDRRSVKIIFLAHGVMAEMISA